MMKVTFVQEKQIATSTLTKPVLKNLPHCPFFLKNAMWFNFVGMGLTQWSLHAVGSIGVNFV